MPSSHTLERGPREVPVAAENVADGWRIMCKHVYDYKKNDRHCTPALHELMDLIELPSRSSQSLSEGELQSSLEAESPIKSMALPLA